MEETTIRKSYVNNPKAITSFVLGLMSVLCCGLITGIPGIVFSLIARSEIRSSGQAGMGLAIAGLTLSIIATLIWIILIIVYTVISMTK